ncbi:hypothetical protein AGABI2DRAFT_122427 [Agaricus bisporus var. bisporus H97]|uniref:hypothetical protein n=1 Tax=Agaricus bisporus var. bisporus (strain H97 / ATCC MYA-4626 / FGSC 10389) TaxID=936046 RepID=UPI00029F5D1E|nr:hypothetical protein AGABI2DRAFT_122427 [Agaricus bisporus var. bisporus H97]EKV42844.1 hypothetical protein AGABI2DRAFT_122427 [Agaricus bisporus var. bisporus H97]
MARDLPAELWLEILSYLSARHVRKLLGINRFLTELALDEIYYSFTLSNGFRRVVSDIQRITGPMYAQRIRRLDIYSCFLANSPEADGGLITRDHSRLLLEAPRPKPSKSTLSALRKWLGSLMISSRTPSSSRLLGKRQNIALNPQRVQPNVLAALNVAFPCWPRVEEISLFLDDFTSMPTFSDFLIDLWSQKGNSIRILNIDASLGGLFEFLEIFLERLEAFPNLERISMKLMPSHVHVVQEAQIDMGKRLAAFVEWHKHSLHTLIISEPILDGWVDVASLTQGLGCLPKLKRIELPVPMERASQSRLEYLERFLNLHAHTLECLLMEYRHSSLFNSSSRYAYYNLLHYVLPKLRLLQLSELEMDVYVDFEPPPIPFRLPPFRLFAPNLKKLTLKGSSGYLTDSELTSLLENMSTGAPLLHSFHFKLEVLRPELLDQLASQLPKLKSLGITYMDISVDADHTFESPRTAFCETFDREYTNWSLKYLRLAKWSICGKGHPDRRLSASVAKSIPGLEVNDNSRSCNCILYNDVLFSN